MYSKMEQYIYMSTLIKLMRWSGLWAENMKELAWAILLYWFLLSCVVMQIWAIDFSSMDEFLSVFVTLLPTIVLRAKVAFTLYYRADVQQIVSDVQHRCQRFAEAFPEHRGVFLSCERKLLTIIKYFLGFTAVVFLFWLSKPALQAARILSDDEVDIGLKISLPIDTNYRPHLVLALLYLLIMAIGMSAELVVLNAFFIGLIMMNCVQLDVLASVLRSLTSVNMKDNLSFCAEMHALILRCGKLIEKMLSPLLLLQFSLGIIILCQILIQIAEAPTGHYIYRYCGFLVVMLSELWLYCFYGSQLIQHSEAVVMAAYDCEWYNMTNTQKKSLAFIALRAHAPLRIIIGNVYVVSLNTFTEVLKMSYSAYTLLRQLK